MKRNHWVRSLHVNQSIFNPEYVYGVSLSSLTFTLGQQLTMIYHR